MNAVCDRLEIPMIGGLIPLAFSCDTWQYRTDGERPYLDNVVDILDDPPREAHRRWYGQRTVTNNAMLWTQAILPKVFRHMKRGNIPFFHHTVRFERRIRSDTGFFVAYQMLDAREIARHHYANRCQQLPSWWSHYEIRQGFWAELGPVFSNYGSYLRDPRQRFWVIFLTEWCVKVAATLIWEVYDCWRLWYLPPRLIELMRRLDYSVPLGDEDTSDEVHSLLDKVQSVD